MVVPEKGFFTRGCGGHKDKLVSFEMALRDAGLAPYNLVTVSSIMPPDAEIISREVRRTVCLSTSILPGPIR